MNSEPAAGDFVVRITGLLPGVGAEFVAARLAGPIEAKLADMLDFELARAGFSGMGSASSEGKTTISLTFDGGGDPGHILDLVRSRVEAVRATLPRDAIVRVEAAP